MVLKNPNLPTECDDRTKEDFHCLMADQLSGDIYLLQYTYFLNPNATMYKFTPTTNSENITLKEIAKFTAQPKSVLSFPHYHWPKAILGGDISRKGPEIVVKS